MNLECEPWLEATAIIDDDPEVIHATLDVKPEYETSLVGLTDELGRPGPGARRLESPRACRVVPGIGGNGEERVTCHVGRCRGRGAEILAAGDESQDSDTRGECDGAKNRIFRIAG